MKMVAHSKGKLDAAEYYKFYNIDPNRKGLLRPRPPQKAHEYL